MITGSSDRIMSSGLITPIAAIPIADLAVPYAAPHPCTSTSIKVYKYISIIVPVKPTAKAIPKAPKMAAQAGHSTCGTSGIAEFNQQSIKQRATITRAGKDQNPLKENEFRNFRATRTSLCGSGKPYEHSSAIKYRTSGHNFDEGQEGTTATTVPMAGIGFVMFWNGGDLSDDGYCWMNRGRTDVIPTHQKSISIEATRFFDGYCPGDKYISMTKTFYRFAGQQTSLFFVHYMSHPPGISLIANQSLDAPKKPVGPAIPTIKPQSKLSQSEAVAPSKLPQGRPKGRVSPVSPIQLPPEIASPATKLPPPSSPQSKTTIRLSMNQPKPVTKISPKRSRRTSEQHQQVEDVPNVFCDFDTWGPVDHSLNQLLRTDAFMTKLFSVTTGISDDQARREVDQSIQKESDGQLIASLKEQLSRSQEDLLWLEQNSTEQHYSDSRFQELDQVDTPEQLIKLAERYEIQLEQQ